MNFFLDSGSSRHVMGSFSVSEKSPGVMALVRSGCDELYPSWTCTNLKETRRDDERERFRT
jgi:hypothetical protein